MCMSTHRNTQREGWQELLQNFDGIYRDCYFASLGFFLHPPTPCLFFFFFFLVKKLLLLAWIFIFESLGDRLFYMLSNPPSPNFYIARFNSNIPSSRKPPLLPRVGLPISEVFFCGDYSPFMCIHLVPHWRGYKTWASRKQRLHLTHLCISSNYHGI